MYPFYFFVRILNADGGVHFESSRTQIFESAYDLACKLHVDTGKRVGILFGGVPDMNRWEFQESFLPCLIYRNKNSRAVVEYFGYGTRPPNQDEQSISDRILEDVV